LEAVRSTGGELIAVSDHEIRAALLDLGRMGFFVEPTSGAAIAGVAHQIGKAGGNDKVVVSVFSGAGLKAPDAMDALIHPRGQRKPGGRSGGLM
jgi:threonine synthase